MLLISLQSPKFNGVTPGLNDTLKAFNASHGVNPLKEKMHKAFKESVYAYYRKHPVDLDAQIYAALDVIDLVEVF